MNLSVMYSNVSLSLQIKEMKPYASTGLLTNENVVQVCEVIFFLNMICKHVVYIKPSLSLDCFSESGWPSQCTAA